MTALDPGPPPLPPLPRMPIRAIVATILVGVVAGVLFQEARWKGMLSAILPSPLTSVDEQLKIAKMEFQSDDDSIALSIFERLAKRNNPIAEYWLGHMTELGLGVKQDSAKAIALYEKAAEQHFPAAEARVGEIYLHGNLTPPAYAKAYDLLKAAAIRKDARAAMWLGQMYKLGLGVRVDRVEAYAWSEVAVVEGLTFARSQRYSYLKESRPLERKAAPRKADALLASIKAADRAASARPEKEPVN